MCVSAGLQCVCVLSGCRGPLGAQLRAVFISPMDYQGPSKGKGVPVLWDQWEALLQCEESLEGDGSHWDVRTGRDWGPSVAAPHSGGRGDRPGETLCWANDNHSPRRWSHRAHLTGEKTEAWPVKCIVQEGITRYWNK